MKVLLALSYLVFLTGFALKFFHIHYNAVIMLVGLAGILLLSLVSLAIRRNRLYPLLNLTTGAWAAFLFVVIKFLPGQYILLAVAIALTLVALYMGVKKKQFNKLWPVGISIGLALAFYTMPTHERYQVLNINWNHELATDYITWDKYAWFLYLNGEYDEALNAAVQAGQIVSETNDIRWAELIREHEQRIRDRNWTSYR
ncbi:hypothetical protein AB9P05_17850 [Roseivirga sp. BDSF3-8]|uniref:hypothetical protein n=1 Tax=Roseivirga sp. BDSF3-8 TaxID=3241598 RepID=UPI00353228CD